MLVLWLQVEPRKRTTIEGVLAHTFLTGGNTLAQDEEALHNIQDTLHQVNKKVGWPTVPSSDRAHKRAK